MQRRQRGDYDLPPKFDEYKDEQEEHQEEIEVKADKVRCLY